MNDSLYNWSLEGIEGKIKLIESIFEYLDDIEEEFESFISFSEKIQHDEVWYLTQNTSFKVGNFSILR